MSAARTIPPITEEFAPGKFRWSWHDRVEQHVRRTHTLLIAEHGVGKTYSLRSIAVGMGRPFFYISASYGIERSHLEGQYLPVYVQGPTGNGGHIALEPLDGIVPSAIQAGGILMIDEFFRLPGDTQAVLFSAMDSHRGIVHIAYRGQTIPVPPEFRVVAATNPPSPSYPEVEIADRALLSRFGAVLRLPFPDGKELARFMRHIGFPREHVVQTVHFVTKVKAAYDKAELDNFVSPRDLQFFSQALGAGLVPNEALEDTIVAKFHDRYHDAIRGFWKMRGGAGKDAADGA